jgi:hypothetical protein
MGVKKIAVQHLFYSPCPSVARRAGNGLSVDRQYMATPLLKHSSLCTYRLFGRVTLFFPMALFIFLIAPLFSYCALIFLLCLLIFIAASPNLLWSRL